MAIFSALSIGRSALLAHQRAISVTGANVANVDTPGYSRQRTVLEPVGEGEGRGVRAVSVERVVDRFLESRGLARESELGDATARRDFLGRIEELFPVDGPSVSTGLEDFFAAASELSTHPEDIAARQDVLDRAEALAGSVRSAARGLADYQREADDRVAQAVLDLNPLLGRVAELNQSIATAQAEGSSPNELADQRREALGEIAEKIGIRTVERDDGTIDVFTQSGAALVVGDRAATLATESSTTMGLDESALSDVGFLSASGELVPLSGPLGGEIGALLDLRDGATVDLSLDLNTFAVTLRDAVNTVQMDAAGRDLDGLVGEALFSGTGAADLTVAIDDPRGLAAAQGSDPANNENALALLDLQTTTFAALGDATLGDFYGSIQSRVGALSRDAADLATVAQSLADSIQAQRESVSGVSLEEEFTDLIRFQRGFQAAAQLISVSDGLLEDLMGMVR